MCLKNNERLPYIKDDVLYLYDFVDLSNQEQQRTADGLYAFHIDKKTDNPSNSKAGFNKDTLENHHKIITNFVKSKF